MFATVGLRLRQYYGAAHVCVRQWRGGYAGDAGEERPREMHVDVGGAGHRQTRAEAVWCCPGLNVPVENDGANVTERWE